MMKTTIFIFLTAFMLSKHALSNNNYMSDKPMNKFRRFILYDANPGEGFNLKRDVYMRLALFIKTLIVKRTDDWYLVLPPWTKQWHWTSEENSVSYPWSKFFDIESLQSFIPIIELDQYYSVYGKIVDEVYILQHFPEFYEWNGKSEMDWSDRWSPAKCRDKYPYWKKDNDRFIFFHGEKQVIAKNVSCISFQGSSAFLESVVSSTNARSIMFDRAEVATHLMFGEADYWMCRRSMRFAKHLVQEANDFRLINLNSSDTEDGTVKPSDWRKEQQSRSMKGGPYLSVHLRRKDFVDGRPKDVPSLTESVKQIKHYLIKENLTSVFIATDMPESELEYIFKSLENLGVKPVKYRDIKKTFSDGEVAIIDQIIASHGKVFIGTFESTFTYRIQEEREIMGFPLESTFNRFCPNSDIKNCTPPTKWLIKYPLNNKSHLSKERKDYERTDEL